MLVVGEIHRRVPSFLPTRFNLSYGFSDQGGRKSTQRWGLTCHCSCGRPGRPGGREHTARRGDRRARTGRRHVTAAGSDRVEPFVSNDDARWQSLIAVSFLGPVRLTRAFLETILAEASTAKIVDIASDAGRVGSLGETVYVGTRGRLIAFTKSLAREMGRRQINVNCVCPGPTDTALLHSLPDQVRQALVRAVPFRRIAKPAEVAEAVLFSASDDASLITGQVLSVSGGLTMAG
ncbi:SDR family oxidoreductase [Mycolicibacterium senegalense]|nr:SDR family oxidoreductase [Mycolicibacterium senegalense]